MLLNPLKGEKKMLVAPLLALTLAVVSPSVDAKTSVSHKCTRNDAKVDLLACAMYAESRGQGKKGMAAVGNVVINRTDDSGYPNSVKGVLYQRGQFSYTGAGSFRAYDKESWEDAKVIAKKLLYLDANFPEVRKAADPTKGATHFKKRTVRTAWQRDMVLVYRYKEHQFYK